MSGCQEMPSIGLYLYHPHPSTQHVSEKKEKRKRRNTKKKSPRMEGLSIVMIAIDFECGGVLDAE